MRGKQLYCSVEKTWHALRPREVYPSLQSENSFLLESSMRSKKLGSHSVIGLEPLIVFSGTGSSYEVNGAKRKGDSFAAFRRLAKKFFVRGGSKKTFFSAGFYGFFSYDLGRRFEKIPSPREKGPALPEIHFVLPSKLIVFDHFAEKALMFGFGWTKKASEAKASGLREKIFLPRKAGSAKAFFPGLFPGRVFSGRIKSDFSRREFVSAAEKAKGFVFSGDVFQVNIAQRFEARLMRSPFELYCRLMKTNPAPFSAFMDFGGFQILSSSPERLVKVENGIISTRPIAGTRPRGKNAAEDRALEAELLSSEKEVAEHSMLVDLERNDIGKVAEPGSVEIAELFTVEKYARVMHLVSEVRGKLRKSLDCFDVVKAVFPGGTITGCPKVRAMQVISALEPHERGPYTGSIGFIGLDNELDLNIAIRTMVVSGKKVFFHAGAGIVADSVPGAEFDETMHKARAMIEALNGAKKP